MRRRVVVAVLAACLSLSPAAWAGQSGADVKWATALDPDLLKPAAVILNGAMTERGLNGMPAIIDRCYKSVAAENTDRDPLRDKTSVCLALDQATVRVYELNKRKAAGSGAAVADIPYLATSAMRARTRAVVGAYYKNSAEFVARFGNAPDVLIALAIEVAKERIGEGRKTR